MRFDLTKEEAKALFFKAKIYRLASVVFGFMGVLVLVFFYREQEAGSFFLIFTDVIAVTLIVVPFLFAFVFSFLGYRLESKLNTFLDSL